MDSNIERYWDFDTSKYNYFKISNEIVAEHLHNKNSSRRIDLNIFMDNYLISGEADEKIAKNKNVAIKKLYNDKCLHFICRFDAKKKKIVKYSSLLHVVPKNVDDHYIYDFDEVYHASRLLKIADGGCTLGAYILLDGFYKGKIYLNETYFQNKSYGAVLLDSFTDFIIMERCK
jgi:hypothetical protein